MNILRKKWFLWTLLALPGLYFMVLPYFTEVYGPKYWGKMVKISGIIAVSLLVLSLVINPLRIIFTKVQFFKELMRTRRNVGVSVFIYACLHLVCFIISKGISLNTLLYAIHPVILPGEIAFFIFLALAITSTDYYVKKMGRGWMRLHKKVYWAEGLVFLHMILQKPKVQILALSLFIPLVIIQYLRIRKQKKNIELEP